MLGEMLRMNFIGNWINHRKLSSLKNIHKGKRCFLVGTGPSLTISDLDRLKNEITFSCNKIYLAFDQTDWRPTYYVIADHLIAVNRNDEIKSLKLKKIFTDIMKPYFMGCKDTVWYKFLDNPDNTQFSYDLLKGAYGGGTVIYDMLQIAFYMGIKQIYLIGIDFTFDISKDSIVKDHPLGKKYEETVLKSSGEAKNYFCKDYQKPGETWTIPKVDLALKTYAAAKEACESKGIKIYNASRRTKLDVFPLVEFEQLFA